MKHTGKLRSFHTIAVPHKDVLDGNLTMDVFAADLWEVYKGRAPAEYSDSDAFFNRTYLTQGLKDLLNVVEKRVTGNGGDPVIQLQTPFGGGKTHALIALYHKSKDWHAKRVVIVGTALQPGETIWGEIERQLTGSITKFTGLVSPGK
ncbi:AAA family ATPase, partial [Candidatus Bathyarchaeota archaeon]|nr:AAA family ATPase [Candidatus Bathyarchaeota archaeon]